MSDFPMYHRRVEPALDDSDAPISARLSLLGTIGRRAGELAAREEAQESSLNKIRYQNMAMEASARAYSQHPDDMDAYKHAYREALEGYPIPLNKRAEYEAILLNSEARFYSPILSNGKQALARDGREELLALADNLFEDGTFVLGGAVGPAAPMDDNYVGDRYLESLDALTATGEDGSTVVPGDEIVRRAEEYELEALSALADRDISSMADPLASTAQYISGEKEYGAEINSSSGAILLNSGELSAPGREQLRRNIGESVVKHLNKRASMDRFAVGQGLVRMPASWRGTAEHRRAMDEWARVQMDAQPIGADNEHLHIDNMVMFARKFSYIPEPYVEVLTANINSGSWALALSASRLLNMAMDAGGGRIAKQFDDGTLLKGQLLGELVWHGNMDPQAAMESVRAIFNNPRSRDYTIDLNNKLKALKNGRDRTAIYGNDVAADEYGLDGVAMYESLVRDYYLTNGGDGVSARKVARARVAALYSYPQYGAYRQHGWLWKSGGRKLKYQPGAYYGTDVEKYIDGDIGANVLPHVRDNMGYPDVAQDNYFLVANMLTAEAFNNSRLTPAWELWYVNKNGTCVQVTDERGNIVTYRLGDGVVPAANNHALEGQALRHSRAVADLHEEMKMPDEERIFLKIMESGGDF
jgi:hypothetical protein